MPSDKAILFKANEAAARHLRERREMRIDVFKRISPELRARSFTAAGIDSMNTLRSLRETCAKFMEGKSFREARSEIAEAFLEKHTPA